MNDAGSTGAALVHGALEECAAAVEMVARERWLIRLSDDFDLQATAWLSERWVRFETAPVASVTDVGQSAMLARLLAWNADLPGCAKFVLTKNEPPIRVRAELPAEDAVDLAGHIVDACRGLKLAAARLRGTAAGASGMAPQRPDAASDFDLAALCRETGWPLIERAPDMMMVELDVPDGFAQASVWPEPPMGIRIAADVGTAAPTSAVCGEAVAAMLLRTGAAVRLARAAIPAGDLGAPRFEVAFSRVPPAGELVHALSALSVAYRLGGRASAILQRDDHVATAYLNAMAMGAARRGQRHDHRT